MLFWPSMAIPIPLPPEEKTDRVAGQPSPILSVAPVQMPATGDVGLPVYVTPNRPAMSRMYPVEASSNQTTSDVLSMTNRSPRESMAILRKPPSDMLLASADVPAVYVE